MTGDLGHADVPGKRVCKWAYRDHTTWTCCPKPLGGGSDEHAFPLGREVRRKQAASSKVVGKGVYTAAGGGDGGWAHSSLSPVCCRRQLWRGTLIPTFCTKQASKIARRDQSQSGRYITSAPAECGFNACCRRALRVNLLTALRLSGEIETSARW